MIYYILFLHWLADFVFQTNNMAKNKSSSFGWLSIHGVEYLCVMVLGLAMLHPHSASWLHWCLLYAAVNTGWHFIIDFFTSKLSSRLYKQGKIHEFFVVIGFDQLLHTVILIYSYQILRGNL